MYVKSKIHQSSPVVHKPASFPFHCYVDANVAHRVQDHSQKELSIRLKARVGHWFKIYGLWRRVEPILKKLPARALTRHGSVQLGWYLFWKSCWNRPARVYIMGMGTLRYHTKNEAAEANPQLPHWGWIFGLHSTGGWKMKVVRIEPNWIYSKVVRTNYI